AGGCEGSPRPAGPGDGGGQRTPPFPAGGRSVLARRRLTLPRLRPWGVRLHPPDEFIGRLDLRQVEGEGPHLCLDLLVGQSLAVGVHVRHLELAPLEVADSRYRQCVVTHLARPAVGAVEHDLHFACGAEHRTVLLDPVNPLDLVRGDGDVALAGEVDVGSPVSHWQPPTSPESSCGWHPLSSYRTALPASMQTSCPASIAASRLRRS